MKMRNIVAGLLAALALSCGSASPEDIDRLDNFADATLSLEDLETAPEIIGDDIGVAHQAWISHQYHGISNTSKFEACYSATDPVNDCLFPTFKAARMLINWAFGASCNHSGVTQAQLTALQGGIIAGINHLYNGDLAGSGTSITTQNTGQGQFVLLECMPEATQGMYASTNPSGIAHTQISNLPVAPNGRDEIKAIQNDSFTIKIHPKKMIAGCGTVVPPTQMQLTNIGRALGVHEGLHALGFGHFDNTVMNNGGSMAFFNCTSAVDAYPPVQAPFKAAITAYSGATGSVSIPVGSLPTPVDE